MKCLSKIAGYVKDSKRIFDHQDDFLSTIHKYCCWTESEVKIASLFQIKSSTKTIEAILHLTSILEYSLGNIFWTKSKKSPPHLLTDLLETTEIKSVFGYTGIFFLQLILGSPNGVNIRNLVWHGFPGDSEVADCYSTILFVIIVSFGKILKETEFKIEFRKKSELTGLEAIEFNCQSKDFSEILKTSLIAPNHLLIWRNILEYFEIEDYVSGIVLLLPQIEMLLRRIYGELNDVSITAELRKYYIILDTIFFEYQVAFLGKTNYREIRDGETNRMFQKFPDDLMNLFYDIFQATEGIRLRDRVSHGEIDLRSSLNMGIFRKLLQVTQMTLEIYELEKLHIVILNYESKFHPNSKFKEVFNETFEVLEKFPKNLAVPDKLQINWNNIDSRFRDFNHLAFERYLEKIKIFFRHESEMEIVRLLTQIAGKVKSTIENYESSLSERFHLYKAKELRSSRRKTLEKTLEKLPNSYDFIWDFQESSAEKFH